jgi:hypothetical protein
MIRLTAPSENAPTVRNWLSVKSLSLYLIETGYPLPNNAKEYITVISPNNTNTFSYNIEIPGIQTFSKQFPVNAIKTWVRLEVKDSESQDWWYFKEQLEFLKEVYNQINKI